MNRAERRRARHYLIGGTKGNAPVTNHNGINWDTAENHARARLEFALAEQIGPVLTEKYPRRRWAVGVDAEGGMMVIVCPSVSNTKGYHIALADPVSGAARTLLELIERAVRGAGEILERHGVSRDRHVNLDNILALPRNVKDDVIAPDAAPEPAIKIGV